MASKRKLFKSLSYIKNHPIKLPASVSKITVVHHTQGYYQAGARHFIYEKFPTIAHFNPKISLKNQRVEKRDNRAFTVVEMADGSQHRLPFSGRTADDFTKVLMEKVQELDKRVDASYAQYLKEWDEKASL